MYIRCWGSRGSVPISGREYVKYGGDTACIEVKTKSGDTVIIDAGTGIRRLGKSLIKEGVQACHFLFTHTHWDHIIGFPSFMPLFTGNMEIKIFRCPFTGPYIEKMLNVVMSPPNFPVRFKDLQANISFVDGCYEKFEIGSATVETIELSHPDQGRGYKFMEDGKTFVFLTDNELRYVHNGGRTFSDYVDFCSGADLLMHDAEYTHEEYKIKKGWGHSVFTDTLELALKAKVKKLGLFHHNSERSDREVDEMVETCNSIIHHNNADLECSAVGYESFFSL